MEILKAENLFYSYHDGQKERIIFNGADVYFEEGRFYTITGDSGSGKTTLLFCLAGLDERYQGTISYKGKDLSSVDLEEYRRNCVSVVFQNYNLIPYLTPLENIRIAMDISDNVSQFNRNSVLGLLNHMGIDQDKAHQKTSLLSGGEQQSVAIARAFSTESEVILCDEPTGNLDENSSMEIVHLFELLAHDYHRCVIVVTHNMKIADSCDIEYRIDQIEKKIVTVK